LQINGVPLMPAERQGAEVPSPPDKTPRPTPRTSKPSPGAFRVLPKEIQSEVYFACAENYGIHDVLALALLPPWNQY